MDTKNTTHHKVHNNLPFTTIELSPAGSTGDDKNLESLGIMILKNKRPAK